MTTNEMILKTIKTKLTKTPIYKSILEDLGYEVFDSEESHYGYWAVKNTETGRMILISQGYDGKRRLYDNCSDIETSDLKKVDYVNLLKTNRPSANNPYASDYVYRNFERGKYYDLREIIKKNKDYIKYKENRIEEYKKQIRNIKKYMACEKEMLDKYIIELCMARDIIKEKRR